MNGHPAIRKHPSRPRLAPVDVMAYIFGVLNPLFTVPQILEIWSKHSVGGVSLYSWGAYLISSCFWVTYATYHKDRPLMLTHGIWVLMNASVVLGILLYR